MDIVTSNNGMKAIIELDTDEIKWWRKKIHEVRAHYILPPKEMVKTYIQSIQSDTNYMERVRDTSQFIRDARDATWSIYINAELELCKTAVNKLLEERVPPHDVLSSIITDDVIANLTTHKNRTELLKHISSLFSNISGRIFPYFFELSKSITNSRRARAGKIFEEIIHAIMNAYSYPYNDQSSLGKALFQKQGLGKIVDGILPSIDAYDTNRSKCLVVTMKTTLRERWQEVVEELSRTNIPSIHLLTLDEGISANVLNLMSNHNITLVTYQDTKDKLSNQHTNIISFEEFFNIEIPHNIAWWRNQAVCVI